MRTEGAKKIEGVKGAVLAAIGSVKDVAQAMRPLVEELRHGLITPAITNIAGDQFNPRQPATPRIHSRLRLPTHHPARQHCRVAAVATTGNPGLKR